jgi:hypothetical protein
MSSTGNSAENSGRSVYGMNCLRSLERWIVGSNSTQGMDVLLCLCYSVCR